MKNVVIEINLKGLRELPVEVIMKGMFDLLMEQDELIERGVRCDKCGELVLPEDLENGLCEDCLMDLAEEIMEAIKMAETRQREEEEKMFEEIVKQLNIMSVVDMEPSVKNSFRFPF